MAGNSFNFSVPNIVLKSALCEAADRLNICHLNVASVFPKIDELRDILLNSKCHVIFLSETWLKSQHSNKSVFLEGFDLVRNDRSFKRGGGVAAYIKKGIKFKTIFSSDKVGSEILFLELIFPATKVLVGVVYKAPNVDEIVLLGNALSNVCDMYEDIIITGDFNENLFGRLNGFCLNCVSRTCSVCRFLDMLSALNLTSVGQTPTHFPHNGRPSLLDLFLTSNVHKFVCFNQISTGLSSHDLIFGSYLCNVGFNVEERVYRRNFKSINLNDLFSDAAQLNFCSIFDVANIDDKVVRFNTMVLSLMDKHAPLKLIIKRPANSMVWFTPEIRHAIIERNLAWSHYKRTLTEHDKLRYRILRNKVISLTRLAKSKFFNPRFASSLGSKRIWKNLNNLGINDKSSSVPNFNSNDYNNYLFANSNRLNHTGHVAAITAVNHTYGAFSFANIDQISVYDAIYKVKSDAIGLDKIPLSFIKLILPVVLPTITHIYNFILTTSNFPTVWKSALVVPVHKKSKTFNPNDFRPICMLPALSKSFEIVVKDQISPYLKRNNLLNSFQSAYQNGLSTSTTLLKVTEDVRRDLVRNCSTIMVLLDFSKAFDSVNHARLLYKLQCLFNFSSSAVSLVQSYLKDRLQAVSIDGVVSSFLQVSCGVPQGSVLGPLLFSMFINDLPDVLYFSKYHLFADDVQIYTSFPNDRLMDCIDRLNSDLSRISYWAVENNLLLNPAKSQAIMFNKSRSNLSAPIVSINSHQIPFSRTVVNLGLTLNNELTWIDHASSIASKVFTRLRSLWKHVDVLPFHTRLNLVKCLIIPLFTYADIVFSSSLDSISKGILARAFKGCVRFAYKVGKRDSVRNHMNSLLGCSLESYFRYRSIVFLRDLIFSKTPCYLYDFLGFGRSARTHNLIIPVHSTLLRSTSFFVRIISVWNRLPSALKSIFSRELFRRELDKIKDQL